MPTIGLMGKVWDSESLFRNYWIYAIYPLWNNGQLPEDAKLQGFGIWRHLGKTATALQPTQPKTPIGGSKQTAPMAKSKTPVKTPKPDTESSEEDSESDEELASKKPATALLSTQPTTPSRGSKQLAVMAKSKTPVKAPQPQIESSEEDSESDKEPASKKPATALPSTPTPKTSSGGSKQTAVMAKSKSPVKAPQPDSESSEEDSESDEEPASKKPATALPSTPTPKTSSGGSKQTAVMAKSKSPVKAPQPDSESSEEDSESDEEPASKKPAAAFPLAQPKTPSGGSKQTAAMAKSNTPVKTPQPDTESSEEDSESDEEPASKKPATALPSTQTPKTSSGGSKQTAAMSKSPVKAPQPDSESSEKDSESDEEPASKKPATALPSAQQKNSSGGSKLTAAMAKSKKPVKIETPDSESSEEDFESDEEPSSMIQMLIQRAVNLLIKSRCSYLKTTSIDLTCIFYTPKKAESGITGSVKLSGCLALLIITSALLKATPPPAAKFTVYPAVVAKQKAGGPTKPVPSTKLAAANQETSDSSESSDGQEEHTGAQKPELRIEAKQKKKPISAPLLTSTPYGTTSSKEISAVPAPVMKKLAAESSDTESDEEKTMPVNTSIPTAVKTVQPKVSAKMKTPSVRSPVPGKTNTSSLQKQKQPDPKSSSDSSDSEEESAVMKVATPATVKVKQGHQTGKVVKTPLSPNPLPGKTNCTSMAKTPLQARDESSSDTSESDEDTAEKVPNKGTPKAAEHLVSSPLPAKEVKGKTRSLTQSPAVQKPATANISSSSSESDEEPAIKSPAATKKNLSQSSVGKTTTPTTMLQKKQESSSEESDSDEEESLKKVTASAGKTQKQTELTIRHTKLKSPSPAKSPVVTKPDDSSDETSSDSGDDLPAQGKGDATRSLASSQKLVGKMSSIASPQNYTSYDNLSKKTA
ncbi:PREDICTED: treacle protein [Nanorana parkeri]|uniref:treacle protein n=1 Tax=Nanorana parkeri TaxID=125878 RepID=UPI000853F7B8|nr:PREDICTED: treacle protein [Nanorana parkeri]